MDHILTSPQSLHHQDQSLLGKTDLQQSYRSQQCLLYSSHFCYLYHSSHLQNRFIWFRGQHQLICIFFSTLHTVCTVLSLQYIALCATFHMTSCMLYYSTTALPLPVSMYLHLSSHLRCQSLHHR
jgi:hypothetical protein